MVKEKLPQIEITNLAEAEDAATQITLLEIREAKAKLKCDQAKAAAGKALADELEPLKAARMNYLGALETYCRAIRAEMAPNKHLDLRCGRAGFRNEPKFSWPKKVENFLAKLKELKLAAYIRVTETPDRAGIAAHYEQLPLRELGVKRTVEEDVFYFDARAEE